MKIYVLTLHRINYQGSIAAYTHKEHIDNEIKRLQFISGVLRLAYDKYKMDPYVFNRIKDRMNMNSIVHVSAGDHFDWHKLEVRG
jgi:hypothetical protein